jgi:hypothetical protein
VDENMQRAQRRGACLGQRFWWRRDVGAPRHVAAAPAAADDAPDNYAEMTINEIVNGKVPLSMQDSFLRRRQVIHTYIHTYHSRFIPEGVAEVSQIPPRHPRFTKIS